MLWRQEKVGVVAKHISIDYIHCRHVLSDELTQWSCWSVQMATISSGTRTSVPSFDLGRR
jgi:hypothetical protein